MPEAPEVRRYADQLSAELAGKKVLELSARTKQARAWLDDHPDALTNKTIERIFAHGKNIVGLLQDDYYFYSHQMMWGSWEIRRGESEIPRDRRERARITVDGATAILMSAPIFELGVGNPLKQLPLLRDLGPYVLPYKGEFDRAEFQRRLLDDENAERTIGDALLDQRIVAGLGNYLRAEIMFLAKMNPWRKVGELKKSDAYVLSELIQRISLQAYKEKGVTVTPALKERLSNDATLVYVPGKEYGTHHYVFRRTNLPCLFCTTPVKQLRQIVTRRDEQDEQIEDPTPDDEADTMTRIVYFCPNCQNVDLDALPAVPKSSHLRKKITLNKPASPAKKTLQPEAPEEEATASTSRKKPTKSTKSKSTKAKPASTKSKQTKKKR